MELITFNQLHLAAIDFVNTENEIYHTQLKVVGKWYHLYLKNNDVKKIYLNVPYYSDDFKVIAFNYLRAFTFLHHFINNAVLCNKYSEKCLFNIFDFKAKKREQTIKDLIFSFKKQKDNILIWGNNEEVITPTDTFLPLFNEQELIDFGDEVATANTFKLFQIIKQHSLVQKPVVVDLKNVIIAFNNLREDNFTTFISECFFNINNRISDDDAENIEVELGSLDLKQSIKIKYPNSIKIHPWITNVAENNFNLILNKRLAYQGIDNDDIYLTLQEIQDQSINFHIPEIEIIETNHSKDLYDHLRLFREDWAKLELNKFVYPFPKYWFLLINNQLTTDEWLTLFSEHYPFINNNSIVDTLKKIISELIAINWTSKLNDTSVNFYFPLLKNNRERKYSHLFSLFKNGLQENISVSHNHQTNNEGSQYFLDAFNTIDVVNKMYTESFSSCKLIIPDFLFYSYNPYLRYSVFKYAYTPFTSEARLILDVENEFKTEELIEKFNAKKTDLLKEARTGIKIYDSIFITESKEEDTNDVIDKEESELIELDFTNEEESEIEEKKYRKKTEQEKSLNTIEITNTNNTVLNLNENDVVLLKKNTTIESRVAGLKKGDLYITLKSLEKDLSNEGNSVININKLSKITAQIKEYKKNLQVKKTPFKDLQKNGATYKNETYFNNKFLKSEEFHLPRRKRNWDVICSYLNISDSDRDLSYIAWKGRADINSLKKMYSDVISFLLEEELMGSMDSNSCIIKVKAEIEQKHFNSYDNLKAKIEDFTTLNYAQIVLANIKNQLVFNEVKSIIKTNHVKK